VLKRISLLTAKLLRLTTYQQLLRGEAQIKSVGIPIDITGEYRDYARQESLNITQKFTPPKPPQVLRVIADKGNTF